MVYCTLAGMKVRWLDKGGPAQARTLFGPVLGLGCALEFIVVVTFEGNGTAKHLFIFNVAVDLCLLMAALNLAEASTRLWRRRSAVTALSEDR
jgi:hypothetical protein